MNRFYGEDSKPCKVVCEVCGFEKVIYPAETCCKGDEIVYRDCPHCKEPTKRKELGFFERLFASFKKDFKPVIKEL